MNTQTLPSPHSDPSAWESALYAFLAEKHRRSGSDRTVESYSRMLQQFFGPLAKPPDQVTASEVMGFAHGRGLSGREPSAVTIAARIACVSSFYRFLIRMGMLAGNPCDLLERPKTQPSVARGLSAEEVQRVLATIPDTTRGRQDRALVLAYVLTARRKAEVLRLTRRDVTVDDGRAFYSYRGKGGKNGRRELPRPVLDALETSLADVGKSLVTLKPDEPLWQDVTGPAFYSRLCGYFRKSRIDASGIHVLRHTAAKLRRDAGESIESVSAFLDHSSLATTTTYLRRLEGEQDGFWGKVADAIGGSPLG